MASLSFLAAGLVTFAILYCVQPVLPDFSKQFHTSPAQSSFLLSITTFLLAGSLPLAATLSDRFGRKPIMAISLFISSLCCILTIFSPTFWALFAVRALQGLVLAGLPAVAMAYLSEEMEAGSLGFAMGLYISGTTIGGLSGRIIVSFLTDIWSWQVAFGAVGIVSLLLTLFFWFNLPPSRHFTRRPITPKRFLQSFAAQFRDPGLVCLFFVGFLLMGGFVTMYNYMGFRLLEPPYNLSQSLVGLIFVVYLVGTFSSSWMGRLADSIGRRKVLGFNIALMSFGALVTLARPIYVIILGVAIFTFGFFGGHSSASSWVGRRAMHGKGQASSLYLLFYYVGSSFGGSLGGVFWARDGWTGTVAMIVISTVLAFMLSMVLAALPNAKPDPAPEKS